MTARRVTLGADLSSSRNAALRRRKLRTTSQRRPYAEQSPSGNWKVWYRTLDGAQKTKTFPDSARWTQAELDRAIDHLLRPINDVRAAALHDDTLWSVYCGWRTQIGPHMKPSTRWTYAAHMVDLRKRGYDGLRVATATKSDIHALLLSLKTAGLASYTIANTRRFLSAMFSYAIDSGLRDTLSPTSGRFKGIPAPRRERAVRTLEPGEINWLLDALPLRERVMVGIAAFAGLRKGEIEALRWNDIPVDCSTIRVDEAAYRCVVSTPKSRSSIRTVDTCDRLAPLLREWRAVNPDALPGDFVFPGHGGPLVLGSVIQGKAFREAFADAGIEPCGWHTFRHTHTTWARNAGVPLEALRDRLGHSTVTMLLNVYSHRTSTAADANAISAYGTQGATV